MRRSRLHGTSSEEDHIDPLADDSEEADITAVPDEDVVFAVANSAPEEVDHTIDIRPATQIVPAPTRRLITATSFTITATIASFLFYYLGLGTLTLTNGGAVFAVAAAIAVAIQRALDSQTNHTLAIEDPTRISNHAGAPFIDTSATGIRIISIAISAGVATITVFIFGGTLVTFGLTILSSNFAITHLSHRFLNRLSPIRLNQIVAPISAVGLRVENFILTEFISRWIRQNNSSGYPAPVSAREAILRGRLQYRGVDVLSAIIGGLTLILTIPISGAVWAATYGVFTYSTLRSIILAYLFVIGRVTQRDIRTELQATGETDFEAQANEIIRLSSSLQTRFGDFLAVLSVVATRVFAVVRHVPFLLLTHLLPSSAQKVLLGVLGVHVAADAVTLAQTVAMVAGGIVVPEDEANFVYDNSPLVRFRRAAVYSIIIGIAIIVPLFVAVNLYSVRTLHANIGMGIGSLALLAILSLVIYNFITSIDSFVLNALPALRSNRRAQLFFGRSEGVTEVEIRARSEALRQAAIIAEELRRADALRVQRELEDTLRGQIELERVTITADGLFVHRVISPAQDPNNPRAIRQVTLDPNTDGYVQIEYYNGRAVTHLPDGSTTDVMLENGLEIQRVLQDPSDSVVINIPLVENLETEIETVVGQQHIAIEIPPQETPRDSWFSRSLRRENIGSEILPPMHTNHMFVTVNESDDQSSDESFESAFSTEVITNDNQVDSTPSVPARRAEDVCVTVDENGDQSSEESFITAHSGSDTSPQSNFPTEGTTNDNQVDSTIESTPNTHSTSSSSSSSSSLGAGNFWSISVETKNINATIFRDNTPKTIDLMPNTMSSEDPKDGNKDKRFVEEKVVSAFSNEEDEDDDTRYDANGNPYDDERMYKPDEAKKKDFTGFYDTFKPGKVNVEDYDPDRSDPTISSRYVDPETWETHPPIVVLNLATMIKSSLKSQHGYHMGPSPHSLIYEFHPPKLIGDMLPHGSFMNFMSH